MLISVGVITDSQPTSDQARFFGRHVDKGADYVGAACAAARELCHHDGDAENADAENVDEQKCRTPAGLRLSGKAPDVSEPDCRTYSCGNQAEF